MAGMLFGMDTGIIGGVIVLPAFTKLASTLILQLKKADL